MKVANPRVGFTGEVTARSDIVISMVPDTPDVEAVLLGSNGVRDAARPGLLVIDMSTVSPSREREMAAILEGEGELGTQTLILALDRLGGFKRETSS